MSNDAGKSFLWYFHLVHVLLIFTLLTKRHTALNNAILDKITRNILQSRPSIVSMPHSQSRTMLLVSLNLKTLATRTDPQPTHLMLISTTTTAKSGWYIYSNSLSAPTSPSPSRLSKQNLTSSCCIHPHCKSSHSIPCCLHMIGKLQTSLSSYKNNKGPKLYWSRCYMSHKTVLLHYYSKISYA